MPAFKTQKRIAAQLLGVSANRIWLDPNRLDEIKQAITRRDIEELIKEKAIKAKPVHGVKRRAGKKHDERRKKGRKRGPGRRKKIVKQRKREYVMLIRRLRSYLRALKNKGVITTNQYQKLRRLAKAGMFSSKKSVDEYIKLKLKQTE